MSAAAKRLRDAMDSVTSPEDARRQPVSTLVAAVAETLPIDVDDQAALAEAEALLEILNTIGLTARNDGYPPA